MENRLKLRVSRMFRSSFGSCRSKNISDVIEQQKPQQLLFAPQTRQHHQLIDLFSPKPPPLPSICRPQIAAVKDSYPPRRKISDRNSLLVSADTNAPRFCPPASPISPLKTFREFQPKKKTHLKKKKKKKTHLKNYSRKYDNLEFNSVAANYYGWNSSDDEDDDDETTFFSSKSLSSDSSNSFRRNKISGGNKSKHNTSSVMMPLEGKVKDSFAVVKRSSDPYGDFRTSMVEMIVERQIFAGKDLEDLLQCFLSLNSDHHHRVIIQVFTEIWETLFSDWA